jgi:hypothetical protein
LRKAHKAQSGNSKDPLAEAREFYKSSKGHSNIAGPSSLHSKLAQNTLAQASREFKEKRDREIEDIAELRRRELGKARREYEEKRSRELGQARREYKSSKKLEKLAKNDPNIANALQESIRSLELEQARRTIDEADFHAQHVISNHNYLELLKKYR